MKKIITAIPRRYIPSVLFGGGVLFFGIFINGVFNLHHVFHDIDKLYHILGGFALGWFFYTHLFFKKADPHGFSWWHQLLIIVSTVCFVGVLWEYAERLSTLYGPAHAPWIYAWFNGGNFNDTLLDLCADMFGAAAFFVLVPQKKV